MSDFKRRPFMAGHTDVFVMAQPFITGTEHINSSGLLDTVEALATEAITQFELSFETEAGTGNFQLDVGTTSESDRTLAAIVEALNTDFGAAAASPLIEAFDYEGCLRIQSLGSGLVDTDGDGVPDTLSFIKIVPNDSGSTFVDGADLFGFPTDPHPMATATAGDLAHAPGRPLTQINRPGVAFLARGEDRVSQNFNRALHQLSINEDSLNTRLKERVPVPTVVDFESSDSRLLVDSSTGNIVGVNLSATFGAGNRVYIGELTKDSSLLDIANFFSVQDQEDNQIQADERVVRVGAVVSGYNPALSTVPTFPSEWEAATSPIGDSTGSLDLGNLLGVQVEKSASVTITEVRDGTVIICDSATFETDGVIPGDVVVISGSTITAPINHNGEYYVETVISETQLEVRPVSHTSVHLLNESESGGLGSAVVRTDGKFAEDVVLLFSPPIADFPPNRVADDGSAVAGILRVVLGTESHLGEVPTSFLARSTVKTAAEVDAFVTRRIWRRMSFDGIYQGQSYDYRGSQQGAGAEGRVTHGPITFNLVSEKDRPASLTAEMTGTGSIEMRSSDLVLTSDDTFVFSDYDIGKIIFVSDTGGSLFADKTPFVLSEFLSYREIRLTPPVDYKDWRNSDLSAPTTCSFVMVSEGQAAAQAALMVVANDLTPTGEDAAKTGYVFVRNHRDLGDTDASPGTSLLHMDRVRKLTDSAGAEQDARLATIHTTAGTTTCRISIGGVDVLPVENMHLFWRSVSSSAGTGAVRDSNGIGTTLIRIVNGDNAGFYVIDELQPSSSGEFTVAPLEKSFDGDATWAGFAASGVTEYANLYNVVSSVGAKATDPDGNPLYSGVTAFADSHDKATGEARAIQSHWIGEGSALYVRVNDDSFSGFSAPNASEGFALDIGVYSPAKGGKIFALGDSENEFADYRYAYGLQVFTNSNVLDSDGSTTDGNDSRPDDFRSLHDVGGALAAVSQYNDPAGYFLIGSLDLGDENVSDSEQNTTAAVVVKDDRGVRGVFTGAVSVQGSSFYSTRSPLISMSPISSSVAVLPIVGGDDQTTSGEVNRSDSEYARVDYGDVEQKVYLDRLGSLTAVEGLQLAFGTPLQTLFTQNLERNPRSAATDPLLHKASYLGGRQVNIGQFDAATTNVLETESATPIEWVDADYSIFKMLHNHVLKVPEDQTYFSEKEFEGLPGRLVYLCFELDSSGEIDVSYLYRVEGIYQDSDFFYLALRADPDDALFTVSRVVLGPNQLIGATTAKLREAGIKAARWTNSYIDIADTMSVGTALNPSTTYISPYLGATRQVEMSESDNGELGERPAALADTDVQSGMAISGVGDSWSAAYLGRGTTNKVSINPSGATKVGGFWRIQNASAPTASGITGFPLHMIPEQNNLFWTDATVDSAKFNFDQPPPFGSEFILGYSGVEWIRGGTYASSDIIPFLEIFPRDSGTEASNLSFLAQELLFTVETTPSDLQSALDANSITDSFLPYAAWTPENGGSIALHARPKGSVLPSLSAGVVRVWVPIGRNFIRTNFRAILNAVLTKVTETSDFEGTILKAGICTQNGTEIFVGALSLSAASSFRGTVITSGTATAYPWTWKTTAALLPEHKSVNSFQAGELGASYGYSPDAELVDPEGNRFSRERPMFAFVDLPIATAATFDAAKSGGFVDDLVYEFEDSGGFSHTSRVLFAEIASIFVDAAPISISAIEVVQNAPDMFISRGLEAAGTVVAKAFRLRDSVKRYVTYPPAHGSFLTGVVYSGLNSSGTTLAGINTPRFAGSGGRIVGKIQPFGLYWGGFGNDMPNIQSVASMPDPNLTIGSRISLVTGRTFLTLLQASGANHLSAATPVSSSWVHSHVAPSSSVNGGTYGYIYDNGVQLGEWNTDFAGSGAPVTAGFWLEPELPPMAMSTGLAGLQITGGNWADPLWYQQSVLAYDYNAFAHTYPERLIQTTQRQYNTLYSDSDDLGAFVTFAERFSLPNPTGFVVPLTGLKTGDKIASVEFHVSVKPHFWLQLYPNYEHAQGTALNQMNTNTATGDSNPNDPNDWWFSQMAGTNDRVNDARQAEWGVYHTIPTESIGGAVSTDLEKWEQNAGFKVEIWRVPLGTNADQRATFFNSSTTKDNHTRQKYFGKPEMIASETVSLEDINLHTKNYTDEPVFVTRYMSDGTLGWEAGGSDVDTTEPDATDVGDGNRGTAEKVFPHEFHLKGSVAQFGGDTDGGRSIRHSTESIVDTSQFAYYATVRFHLSGNRVFTAQKIYKVGDGLPGITVLTLGDIDSFWIDSESELRVTTATRFTNQTLIVEPFELMSYAAGRGLRVCNPPHGAQRLSYSGFGLGFTQAHDPVQVTLRGMRVTLDTDIP